MRYWTSVVMDIIEKFSDTRELAKRIRLHALEMTHTGGSSHVGSVLSMTDIIAVLYGEVLNYNSANPSCDNRDRFILSKGHAGAGVYAALAECGFFSTNELAQHYKNGSKFSGHVSHKSVPGVEFSTGSLGHGLSIAAGIALSAHLNVTKYFVDVVLSDGELGEGSNWEALLFAAHHGLSNLTITIDYKKLQSLKSVDETLKMSPLHDKFISFGMHVQIVDGHNHTQLLDAFKVARLETKQPSVIIANTVKGKGVSFMENQVLWHYRSPQGNEYLNAKQELEGL